VSTPAALISGLALLGIALVLTLSSSPLTLAGLSTPSDESVVTSTYGDITVCQRGETVPRDTTALRLSMTALSVGPRLAVKISERSHVVAEGTKRAGWSGGAVTVPIAPDTRALADATVCISLGPDSESTLMSGGAAAPGTVTTSTGEQLGDKEEIEYLQPDDRSWLSLASSIGRRIGLDRAWGSGGTILTLLLMATLAALSTWLILKELREPR
jgi:hypothetical protein